MIISPTRREVISKDGACLVALAGDFLNYKSFPQLSSMFMVQPPSSEILNIFET